MTDRQPEDQLLRLVASYAPGASLALRRKRVRSGDTRLAPVLLVHGATFGAALFDLPERSYSIMATLATSGRTVYALDIRGYGKSRTAGVMDEPPERNPPFATIDAAVDDIARAIDYILGTHGVPKLCLVGFSWGTITAASVAASAANRIAGLVLYAPIFAGTGTIPLNVLSGSSVADPIRTLGAYRLITHEDVVRRWDADLPRGQSLQYREDSAPRMLFEAAAALDPRAETCSPRAFRCPNGALVDLAQVTAGKRLYDPAKLVMPTLLVRGADDKTSTDADARELLSLIGGSTKQYRVIAPGSHFLCVERNRATLYGEIRDFLDETEKNDG